MGIYRYWTGYNPVGWNANQTGIVNPTYPITASTASAIAVDYLGNPVAPRGTGRYSYTGRLQCFSIFGTKRLDENFNLVPFTANDCPGGQIGRASTSDGLWDRFRPVPDTTGYMRKILSVMPRANWFWQQRRIEYWPTTLAAPAGRSQRAVCHRRADVYSNNKQINLKIDHNFSPKHTLAVSWTRQSDNSADNVASYPDGPNGVVLRHPDVVTANLTSTLSSRMVNEARFGLKPRAELQRICVSPSG
jgi:hypothetical protein